MPEESLPSYTSAKRPPPASRNELASHVASLNGHAANRFIPAFSAFLQSRKLNYIPREFDVFGLRKEVVIRLSVIPKVGSRHTLDLVRACGPVNEMFSGAGRRRIPEPVHLDYALIRAAETDALTAGTALEACGASQRHIPASLALSHHVEGTSSRTLNGSPFP